MKGLLKGLRFITRVFENEKEPEMQIGIPTDVKHVAHIGWEGPSSTTPSWMNEFKAPELMAERYDSKGGGSSRKAGSSSNKQSEKQKGRRKFSTGKQRGQSRGSGSSLELPSQIEQSAETKHSRQKKSKGSCGSSEAAAPSRPARSQEKEVEGIMVLGTSTGR